jgi:hypothetical protein
MFLKVKQWCRGRSVTARGLLLVFLIYVGYRHFVNPDYCSIFGGVNLGVHELGHIIFGFAGEFVSIAGGTILQLAAPIACAVMFLRQPDYYALCLCGVWLSTNLYGIATYVADARELVLPLVSVGGGEVIHDWNYMLSRMNILSWDKAIAAFLRGCALILMWGSIIIAIWMLWEMAVFKIRGGNLDGSRN